MPKLVGNVLSWGSDVEDSTIEQAQKAASLPIVRGHLALMADAHIGIGATIGSVIPTNGAVIPAAVGVDIGCGVAGVMTNLVAADLPGDLTKLHSRIRAVVPAGVGQGHDKEQPLWEYGLEIPERFDQRERSTARRQFGSLGSGNHFVEVCLDEADRVWVILHSGSRGIGNQLATKHIKIARERALLHRVELPDPDLAWLEEGSREFAAYIDDMTWAQQYALCNRARMLHNILDAFDRFMAPMAFSSGELVNNPHNFTRKEEHRGEIVWLTRKGAIPAGLGELGIIPGSMGTCSYIVEGLGNADSYCSCSHGAGRRLSRGQARRTLTTDTLQTYMAGRAWNSDDAAALLDEHPEAYKDLDVVMEDQKDLVRVRHRLRAVLRPYVAFRIAPPMWRTGICGVEPGRASFGLVASASSPDGVHIVASARRARSFFLLEFRRGGGDGDSRTIGAVGGRHCWSAGEVGVRPIDGGQAHATCREAEPLHR